MAPARDPAGRDLVLKVGWRHPDAEHEAAGLRAWRDRGAVRVYVEHAGGPQHRAAARTGPAGHRAVDRARRTGAGRGRWPRCCATSGTNRRPATRSAPLAELCDDWADEFERRLRGASRTALDPGLARAGMELFRGLPRDAAAAAAAGHRPARGQRAGRSAPALAADRPEAVRRRPGLRRAPAPAQLPRRLTADPRRLADRMAALLDLDRDRLRRWLFARCVQECVDQPWLRPVASSLRSRCAGCS